MVKALMSEKNELQKKEAQWQQERKSLIEQFKLALDRQFAKRSEALKPYNEAQGDLFNEEECEAAKAEEEVVTSTTKTQRRGKRQPKQSRAGMPCCLLGGLQWLPANRWLWCL